MIRIMAHIGMLASLVFLLLPLRAFAFPEMVRAGYTNCTTCHVSPTGGGLLTDYGRNLSAEVLSTWGTEKEAQVGHGLLPERGESKEEDKWFGIGGDIRAAQTHVENQFVKAGRYIWMQAMLDLGYRYKSWTAVMSIGKFDRRGLGEWKADSPRYYLMKQFNDENLVRVGRFIPAFGLNIPEHISPTRGGTQGNGLGFGIHQERDAAEWHYIGENWNFAAGYSKGPRDGRSPLEEAVHAQIQRAFAEHHKVGISLWSGHGPTDKRQIVGVHGLFGFSPHLYLLTETDWQFLQQQTRKDQTGIFGYHKLGYEFHKGMHAFAVVDHLQANLKDSKNFTRHWGGGFQFFPRPHFEITATWTRQLIKSLSTKEGDYAWILLHYYL